MILTRGEKIRLIKPINKKMNLIGEIYEIGDITGTNIIIRTEKTKVAILSIGVDEFPEYFDKYKSTKWTPWTAVDGEGSVIGFYRTNGKKVQFESSDKKYRTESTCSKVDEFDIRIGLRITFLRYLDKKNKDNVEKLTDMLEVLKAERVFVDRELRETINNVRTKKGE